MPQDQCVIISTNFIQDKSFQNSNQRVQQRTNQQIAARSSRFFFAPAFFILILSIIIYPFSTHAGFWSDVVSIFSGTNTSAKGQVSSPLLPLLESQQAPPVSENGDTEIAFTDDTPLQVTDNSALVAPHNPIGVYTDTSHDEIIVYTVKSGDSPSGIAKRFGITLNTLLWANDIRTSSSIRVGDQLVILPVSGIQYEIKQGDTIQSIAKRFKPKDESDIASVVTEILQFNGLAINEILEVGSTIIIPDGEISVPNAPSVPSASQSPVITRSNALPEYIGYFLRPVIGGRNVRATKKNPHGLHGYNGIDLAVDYSSPVMASAEGTVIRAKSTGWNGGYGKYMIITHSNGTQTLYAHMSSLLVEVGQRVIQGAPIGYVGSSGNSTGPHVHFEIRGAKNPF